MQPVIDDLGLDTTVKELAASVTASNPDGTMLVDISVNDPDPKQASSIANSVAENLRKQVTSTIYSDPDVYLEVQHPCWSCNSNSSSANASAGVR